MTRTPGPSLTLTKRRGGVVGAAGAFDVVAAVIAVVFVVVAWARLGRDL